MSTLRTTAQMASLGLSLLLALPAGRAIAQNYNNQYNNGYNNQYNDGYNNQYNDGYDDDYDGSYQDFYDALSPYGQWINDPQYGYVWVPDVSQDFRPYYTNGYWTMTEYGNTWVSNYNWGWAAFHYGRWTFDDYYGWVWIPGNEWAPAWVNWRNTNNGYYGWAPLGPGNLNAYSNDYYGYSSWWVFAPQQYLYSPRIYNYVRSPRYNNEYLRRSTIIRDQRPLTDGRRGGIRYFAGPSREAIQRATGRPIPVYSLNNARRAGATRVDNNAINIFRPNIRVNSSRSRDMRPPQVQTGQIRVNANPGSLRNNADVQIPVPGRIRENRPLITTPQNGGNNNGMRPSRDNGRGDQLRDQQRAQQDQQMRDQRIQQEQLRNQDDQRRQQMQLREQQRAQQDQQRQQVREQQRAQQEQQRSQMDQQRSMQEQQRAQMDQQRAQMEQQRAQQEQQRQQMREQQRAQQDQQRAQMEQQRQQQMQQRQQVEQQRQQQIQQRQIQEARPVQRAEPQRAEPAQIQRFDGGRRR